MAIQSPRHTWQMDVIWVGVVGVGSRKQGVAGGRQEAWGRGGGGEEGPSCWERRVARERLHSREPPPLGGERESDMQMQAGTPWHPMAPHGTENQRWREGATRKRGSALARPSEWADEMAIRPPVPRQISGSSAVIGTRGTSVPFATSSVIVDLPGSTHRSGRMPQERSDEGSSRKTTSCGPSQSSVLLTKRNLPTWHTDATHHVEPRESLTRRGAGSSPKLHGRRRA